jgi:hypothetical protein
MDTPEWEYSPKDGASTLENYPYALATSAANAYGVPIAAVAMQGISGNTFEFEYVVYTEYIGPAFDATLSESGIDPAGVSVARQALSKVGEYTAAGLTYARATAKSLADLDKMAAVGIGISGLASAMSIPAMSIPGPAAFANTLAAA